MSYLHVPSRFREPSGDSVEMLVVHGFREVTDDSVLQGAIADDLIRVGCNEDRGTFIPRIYQILVELNSCHSWHLNVGDQAGGCR